LSVNGLVAPYDVAPDGKRFVVVTVEPGKSFPINLVTNWTSPLGKQQLSIIFTLKFLGAQVREPVLFLGTIPPRTGRIYGSIYGIP